MTETEKIKLAMYDSVLLFLSENKDIVNTIRAFNWSIIKLRRIMAEIRLKEIILSDETLEKAIKIAKTRDALIQTLVQMSTTLFSLSYEISDPGIKPKYKLTQNSLVHLLDYDLIEKADSTLSLSQKCLAKFKRYNLSYTERKILRKKIEELRQNTEAFKDALHTKLTSYLQSNTVLSISLSFAECDKILSSYIDNFVEALADNFPYFHDEYLWMRNIDNQNEIRTLLEIEE